MKPRVFVSSTYYDLKYVRETLEHFIMQYGFDAVLFESGNVTFEHGKSLDTSCYQEVDTCQMMLLIIGGRYGSASSTETEVEIRKKYDEQYVSITRSEFDTAYKKGIPIFVFIDKNVYSEYQTYKKNEDFFQRLRQSKKEEKQSKDLKAIDFNFAHVDSYNIFKFVDHVNHLAVKTFERADEIIDYLRTQLAGMFYLYLDQAKREGTNKEILTSVEQLNSTATKIDTLVDAIARKVIGEQQFKDIEMKQFISVSEIFSEQLDKYIDFTIIDSPVSQEFADKLADILIRNVFNQDINIETPKQISSSYNTLQKDIPELVAKHIHRDIPNIKVNKLQFYTLYRQYKRNILPFIDNDKKKDIFKQHLINNIYSIGLPF